MGPRARQENLLIEPVGRELVVFDRTRNTAHHLNEAATIVWRGCDGDTAVPELVGHLRRAGLDGDETLVLATLDQLERAELLTSPALVGLQLDRRAALRAAAFLVPAVVSIVVPTPAEAASGGFLTPTPPCLFTATPLTVSVPANGGSGTISLFASDASCGWTTSGGGAWISLSPLGASGSGPVSWTAQLNPTSDRRTATATIAGQTVTFTQDARMMELTDINGTYNGTVTLQTPPCQPGFFSPSSSIMVVIDVNANGTGTLTHSNPLGLYPRRYTGAVAEKIGDSSVRVVTNKLNTVINEQLYTTQVEALVDTSTTTYTATESLTNSKTGCKDTCKTVAKK